MAGTTTPVSSEDQAKEALVKIVTEANAEVKANVEKLGRVTSETKTKLDNMRQHLEDHVETELERKIREYKDSQAEKEKEREELSKKSAEEIAEIKAREKEHNDKLEEIKKMIIEVSKPHNLNTRESDEMKQQIEEMFFNELRVHSHATLVKFGRAENKKFIDLFLQTRMDDPETYERYLKWQNAIETKVPKGIEEKAYTAANYSQAGVLTMPYQVMNSILDTSVQELSPIRMVADVETVTRPGYEFPIQSAHAVALRSGETATRTEDTTADFGSRKIAAHEMYVYYILTHELLEDAAFDMRGVFRREVANAIAVKEGTESISGDGVVGFRGLGKAAADSLISYKPTGVSGDLQDPRYVMDLVFDVKEIYRRNASWMMRRASVPKFIGMIDGSGALYANSTFVVTYNPVTRDIEVMGHPVYMHPDVAAFGASAYVAYFGDFKEGYKIIDKTTETVFIEDPYSSKSTGKVEYFVRYRSGGDYKKAEAIRAFKASAS